MWLINQKYAEKSKWLGGSKSFVLLDLYVEVNTLLNNN